MSVPSLDRCMCRMFNERYDCWPCDATCLFRDSAGNKEHHCSVHCHQEYHCKPWPREEPLPADPPHLTEEKRKKLIQ